MTNNSNDSPRNRLIASLEPTLKAMPIAACIKDPDCRIAICTKAFEELHGIDSSELIGRKSNEAFGESGELDLSTDKEALEAPDAISHEAIVVNAQLELRELLVKKKAILDSETGDRIGIICTYEDKTDVNSAKRELARSRVIIDSARDTFLIVERESFTVMDCNQHAASNLLHTRETLLQLNPIAVMPQISEDRLRQLFESAETKGAETVETIIMRADGTVFDSEIRIYPVDSEFEDLFVLSIRDQTFRKQAEQELQKANHTLRLIGSINKILVSSETEQELMERICREVNEQASLNTVFAIVSHSEGSSRQSVYCSSENADPLEHQLEKMGFDKNEITKIGSIGFDQPILRTAQPKMETKTGSLPTWILPKNGSCLCIADRPEDGPHVSLVIFAKEPSTFDQKSIDLIRELQQEISYGIRSLEGKNAKQLADKRIAEQLDIESAISRFSSCLLKSSEMKSGIRAALPNLLKATGADQVFLYEFPDDSHSKEIAHRQCEFQKKDLPNPSYTPSSINLDSQLPRWSEMLRHRRSIDTDVFEVQPEERSYLKLDKNSRLLLFPIHARHEWIGFLGIKLAKQVSDEAHIKKEMLAMSADLLAEQFAKQRSNRHFKMLASAINASDEGVIISTADSSFSESKIVFANDGLCRMTGYTKDVILAKSPNFTQAKEMTSDTEGEMMAELQSGKAHSSEIIASRLDGSSFNCERRLYPISNHEGKISNYLCILRDITEQKQLESRVSFANKLESIGQLSAGIAHEINTPSQFIGDNLNFLNDAWGKLQPITNHIAECDDLGQLVGDEEIAASLSPKNLARILSNIPEAISDAIEGVDRISTIVKAMREFSHPERRMAQVDLNKCINTTVTVARNEWKYISDLTLELDDELPLVECMPGDINQVLLNLIVNAAQAIESKLGDTADKGEITITTKKSDESAYIMITDTGGGIPDEIGSYIFDPFFTTKEVGKGTGQGLFMAHSIIEQNHHGRIWFDSNQGVGTTFHIQLPLSHEEAASDERN